MVFSLSPSTRVMCLFIKVVGYWGGESNPPLARDTVRPHGRFPSPFTVCNRLQARAADPKAPDSQLVTDYELAGIVHQA